MRAPNWVGDAVMSVPALQALRTRFPEAHISILAHPSVSGLYERERFCGEVIVYRRGQGIRRLRDIWRAAADLRRRKFDCAILLPNSFESAAIVRLTGIRVRIGYSRDSRALLLSHPIPVPSPGETPRHQRFYYLELLKRARLIESYSPDSPVRLSPAISSPAAARVIGVSPGAAYGGAKRWLPERFAEAAVRIARERDASVAVFGSRQEIVVCEVVSSAIQAADIACVNFAGQTTLAEFIERAAACAVFLTNDSGAMHIASALGVPTVAVFGPTDDEATGPAGTQSRVIRHLVECSPCMLRECPIDHRCMTRVPSSLVAETALTLLAADRQNA